MADGEARSVTQAVVAAKAGISESALSAMLTGKRGMAVSVPRRWRGTSERRST